MLITLAWTLALAAPSLASDMVAVLDRDTAHPHGAISGYLDVDIGAPFRAWDFPGLVNGMTTIAIRRPDGSIITVDQESMLGLHLDGFDSGRAPGIDFPAGKYVMPFFFVKRAQDHGGFLLQEPGRYEVRFTMRLPGETLESKAAVTVGECDADDRDRYDGLFSAKIAYMFPFQRPLRSEQVAAWEGCYAQDARIALAYCVDAHETTRITYLLEGLQDGGTGADAADADDLGDFVEVARMAHEVSVGLPSARLFWADILSRIDPAFAGGGEPDPPGFPDGPYRVVLLR